MSDIQIRTFNGKRYRLCAKRRLRRRAETYAINAKHIGFISSYRIIKIDGLWHVYGFGKKKMDLREYVREEKKRRKKRY